jgi:hypothetical protein
MVTPTVASAIAAAVRRRLAREASTLRDAVRQADLPLPLAVMLASFLTLAMYALRPGQAAPGPPARPSR